MHNKKLRLPTNGKAEHLFGFVEAESNQPIAVRPPSG